MLQLYHWQLWLSATSAVNAVRQLLDSCEHWLTTPRCCAVYHCTVAWVTCTQLQSQTSWGEEDVVSVHQSPPPEPSPVHRPLGHCQPQSAPLQWVHLTSPWPVSLSELQLAPPHTALSEHLIQLMMSSAVPDRLVAVVAMNSSSTSLSVPRLTVQSEWMELSASQLQCYWQHSWWDSLHSTATVLQPVSRLLPKHSLYSLLMLLLHTATVCNINYGTSLILTNYCKLQTLTDICEIKQLLFKLSLTWRQTKQSCKIHNHLSIKNGLIKIKILHVGKFSPRKITEMPLLPGIYFLQLQKSWQQKCFPLSSAILNR